MIDSATTNRRERRMQETAARLTAVTRRLTAERGLSGFTIEEVCDEVDVSRRTFFNYFHTKEDAVLGADPEEQSQQFAAEFLARESAGWPRVIDDLVDLVIVHFATAGVDLAAHTLFSAAVEREPGLLLRFMGVTRERERQALLLVATREGVSADDARAAASVSVLSTVLRTASESFLDPSNSRDFGVILREHLAALRTVLADPASAL